MLENYSRFVIELFPGFVLCIDASSVIWYCNFKSDVMDINNLIQQFKMRLELQRYSPNSIKNYVSAVHSFLEVASQKFNHPEKMKEDDIEKYVQWKIQKHKIGASHQRTIVASIGEFYQLLFDKKLKIKHLYPSRRSRPLPKY